MNLLRPITDAKRTFLRQTLFDNGMSMPAEELAFEFQANGFKDFAGALACLLQDGDVIMSEDAENVLLNV